jgi:hypothetical protein
LLSMQTLQADWIALRLALEASVAEATACH